MVALLRLLDVVQVLVEVLLREERSAVDAREHRAGRIAAPVRAGHVRELEGLDRRRVLQMRAAAEVAEVVLRIDRQRLVGRQVVDQLDLVCLVLVDEALADRVAIRRLAREGVLLLEDATHLVFDAYEIGFANLLGELEVVVEAVIDGRPDRDLHAGEDVARGLGQHVRRRVAQDRQGLLVTDAQDLHLRAVGERQAQITHLPIDLDGSGHLGESLTDRTSTVEAGRAVLELELRAVGKMNLHALRLSTGRNPTRHPRSNDVMAWNSPTRVSTSSRVRRWTRSVPNSSTLNEATIEP